MKTMSLLRALSVVSVLALAPFSVSSVQAISLSASSSIPNGLVFIPPSTYFPNGIAGTYGNTEDNPTIGTFVFGAGASSLTQIRGMSFNISLWGLDTMPPAGGASDFNNITIRVDGIETGLKLNNFGNSLTTAYNYVNDTALMSSILTALKADGQLVVSLYDANGAANGTNFFAFGGGVATLLVSEQPIPFTPAHSLGFALLGLGLLVRRFSAVKRILGLA